MQPCEWLKTKKKLMDPNESDSQNQTHPLFSFDHLITSKKHKKTTNHLSHNLSTPTLTTSGYLQSSKQSPERNTLKANDPDPEADLASSLKQMKISPVTILSNKLNYDPDEIFALLDRNSKPEQKRSKKKEELQNQNEMNRFDISEEELDKVSIFTFGPINLEDKAEQEIQVQRKMSLREYRQAKCEEHRKKPENVNPLLYLQPSDYQVFKQEGTQYELFCAKKKDPFLERYIEKKYEPKKIDIKKQIKHQITQLLQVRKGSYLINTIFNQVLEESLALNNLQKQVDEQITKCKNKLQLSGDHSNCQNEQNLVSQKSPKSLQDHKNQMIELTYSANQKFSANELESCNQDIKSSTIKQKDNLGSFDQARKQNEFLRQSKTEPLNLDQNQRHLTDQLDQRQNVISFPVNTQDDQENLNESLMKPLDQQISGLKTLIHQQQKILHQEVIKERVIVKAYEQTRKQLIETNNFKNITIRQLSSLSRQSEITKQNIINQIKNEEQIMNELLSKIDEKAELSKQKMKEMLQHIFDVVYVQLQILSNKVFKHSIDKAKSIFHSDTSKSQSILQEFYQSFIESSTLIGFLNLEKSLDEFIDNQQLERLSVQDLKEFYFQLQKSVKAYLCFKIEQQRYESEKGQKSQNELERMQQQSQKSEMKENQQVRFIKELFNLFDTNSYHSHTVKQDFFHFQKHFITYGYKVFLLILKTISKNKQIVDFGQHSNDLQRLELRQFIKKQNYNDNLLGLLIDSNDSTNQIISQNLHLFATYLEDLIRMS